MPAETRLFKCLSDNYGVLLHDPDTGATASIDAPEAAPHRGRAEADRLEAHRHPGHPSPPRPHRRHRGAEGEVQVPRGGAGQGGVQDPRRRRDREPGRFRVRRQAAGDGARHPRPHPRPYHLLVSAGPPRLRRRHAVFHRLRPRHRRHAGDDVEVAAQAARSAERDAGLLRARIHRRQHPLRAQHRHRTTRCWRRARRRSSS